MELDCTPDALYHPRVDHNQYVKLSRMTAVCKLISELSLKSLALSEHPEISTSEFAVFPPAQRTEDLRGKQKQRKRQIINEAPNFLSRYGVYGVLYAT